MYLIIFAFQSPLKCIHLPCRVHDSSTRTNTSKTSHPTKKKWNVQPLTTNPTLTSHHAPDWDRGNFLFSFSIVCWVAGQFLSHPSPKPEDRTALWACSVTVALHHLLYSKLCPHSLSSWLSLPGDSPLVPGNVQAPLSSPNLNKAGLFVTQDTSELHMLNSCSPEGPVTRLSIEVTDLLRHLFSTLFS